MIWGYMDMPTGLRNSQIRSIEVSRSMLGSKAVVALCCFPFFKTDFYESLGALGTLANSMLVVETCVFGAFFLLCGYKSKLILSVLLYFIWSLIVAPLFSGFPPPTTYYLFSGFGFLLFVIVGLKSARLKFINALSGVFCFAVLFNAALLTLYPQGVFQTPAGRVWLFGIRTGFSYVIIPALCFCLLYDVAAKRATFSCRTILTFLAALYSILNQWVATGLVELALMIMLYVMAYNGIRFRYRLFTCLSLLLAFFILTSGPATIVGDLVDMLGKDATFTGRTDIWACVINDIVAHPLFGCGGIEYVLVFGEIKAFHSLWLSVCHESGLIGLAFFLGAFFLSASNLKRANNTIALVVGCALFPIMLASIVEIQTYFPFIYGVLAFSEYACLMHCSEDDVVSLPVLMRIR